MIESRSFRIDWDFLVDECKRGEIAAHLAIDFAVQMPTQPPVGPITRDILMIWAGCKGKLRGGSFRFQKGSGFGVRANRHEPFLSRVCGADRAAQFAVFLDLAKHEPAGAKAVFERIHELAANAAEEVPNIGRMAMPPLAKQMLLAMCRFMIRLGETARAAEDRNPYGVLGS